MCFFLQTIGTLCLNQTWALAVEQKAKNKRLSIRHCIIERTANRLVRCSWISSRIYWVDRYQFGTLCLLHTSGRAPPMHPTFAFPINIPRLNILRLMHLLPLAARRAFCVPNIFRQVKSRKKRNKIRLLTSESDPLIRRPGFLIEVLKALDVLTLNCSELTKLKLLLSMKDSTFQIRCFIDGREVRMESSSYKPSLTNCLSYELPLSTTLSPMWPVMACARTCW